MPKVGNLKAKISNQKLERPEYQKSQWSKNRFKNNSICS